MFKRLSVATATLIFAGTQAFAQTAAPAPAAITAPVPEKKICRSVVPTGSIMGKRICLTKTEWREFDGINANATETFRNRPGSICGQSATGQSCE